MSLRGLVGSVKASPPDSQEFLDASRSLASLAFERDRPVAEAATRAIFADIVEPWSDRFEPVLCECYLAFMSEVMYAEGSPVKADLAGLGLAGPAELRTRYSALKDNRHHDRFDRGRVKSVVVLSRVTLGADVAVTSAVIRAALESFKTARVEFIAPKKNLNLIAGEDRVDGYEISYGRTALLGDRLAAWTELRERVRERANSLAPEEFVVIDPDSRLTQLGLLPLADDRSYRFFESRSAAPDSEAPLGRLAVEWCSSMWDVDVDVAEPFLSPRSCERQMRDGLVADQDSRVATVSFGVGGRDAKRMDGRFEDDVLELLRNRGYLTVLDYGAGYAEARVVEQRYRAFSGSKSQRDEGDVSSFGPTELTTWRGSIQGFGCLIGSSHVYIGYDSAAAHLAAAQGVPVISVFAGAPSERFRHRWTPWGHGPVRVIPTRGPQDREAVLSGIEASLAEFESTAERGLDDRN